jgi:hypothetical protein
MSPDLPGADQHVGDPQSWNLYAYGRNDPMRFGDPSGRWVWDVSAGGKFTDEELVARSNDRKLDGKARSEAEKALEFRKYFRAGFASATTAAALAAASDRSYGSGVDSLKAYGTENVGSSVIVGVDTGRLRKNEDAFTGISDDDKVNVDFTMATAKKGNYFAATIAHEGRHAMDAIDWLGTVPHCTRCFNDLSLWDRESMAWDVGGIVAQFLGMEAFGPGPTNMQVWNKNWKPDEIRGNRAVAIRNILNDQKYSKDAVYSTFHILHLK